MNLRLSLSYYRRLMACTNRKWISSRPHYNPLASQSTLSQGSIDHLSMVSTRKQVKAKSLSTNKDIDILKAPITVVQGVGPKLKQSLSNLKIATVADALFTFPVNIVNWEKYEQIVRHDHMDNIKIYLVVVDSIIERYGSYPTSVVCKDMLGNELRLTFFAASQYIPNIMRTYEGSKLLVKGKVKYNSWSKCLEIQSPEYREFNKRSSYTKSNDHSIECIYKLTEGVQQPTIRRVIRGAMDKVSYLRNDWLPDSIKSKMDWVSSLDSLKMIHQPANVSQINLQSKCIERLAFDELVSKQLVFKIKAANDDKIIRQSYGIDGPSHLTTYFQKSLPFKLTSCQINAVDMIFEDLKNHRKMRHLLHGDVGSGKSVVSFLAMLRAVECGKQCLLLAPTDILASQHYESFQSNLNIMMSQNSTIFQESNLPKLGYLTGSVIGKKREKLHADIKQGQVDIVIGTHALLTEGVFDLFQDVGLVVIDEEQRFGVEQRNILADRSNVLITTATPIPRSQLLVVQDEYTVSTLLAKPSNKRAIKTIIYPKHVIEKIIETVGSNIEHGSKVFWVCASLNPVKTAPGQSTLERYDELSKRFPGKVGLIHGQMSAEDKLRIMKQFSSRDSNIRVLVSTSVIEVGIDVPDVSILIIDRAERFGLSQLHQLRGRIGRGDKPTTEKIEKCYCILIHSDEVNIDGDLSLSLERLKILEENDDGFKIAEEDLRLRGPGDIFGTLQSGKSKYRVASMPHHSYLLDEAKSTAISILNHRRSESLKGSNNLDISAIENPMLKIFFDDEELQLVRAFLLDQILETSSSMVVQPLRKKISQPKTKLAKRIEDPVENVEVPSSAFDIDQYLTIVVDLETTGLSPQNDRIIQLAACVLDDTDQNYNSFVYHENCKVPSKISKITGITDDILLSKGKSFENVWEDFMRWIDSQRVAHEGKYSNDKDVNDAVTGAGKQLPPVLLIAHNGKRFDFQFMSNEINRVLSKKSKNVTLKDWTILWKSNMSPKEIDSSPSALPIWLLDSIELMNDKRVVEGYDLTKKSLSYLYHFVTNSDIINAHDALADVQALSEVLQSEKFNSRWKTAAKNYIRHVTESYSIMPRENI